MLRYKVSLQLLCRGVPPKFLFEENFVSLFRTYIVI